MNWFKHNFKGNKKEIALINKELKDVKDKELLKELYESYRNRQYHAVEIFNGITLHSVEIRRGELQVEASPVAAVETHEKDNVCDEQEEKITEISTVPEQNLLQEETVKTDLFKFNNFLMSGFEKVENGADEEEEIEEGCVLEECSEDHSEEIEGGIIDAVAKNTA